MLDLLPAPNGRIYDIDSPGHAVSLQSGYQDIDQNTIVFTRYNFKQYATFKGVRCSNDFEWFVRLTTKKTSPVGQNGCVFYDRPGQNDNQCGKGQTTLTIDNQ